MLTTTFRTAPAPAPPGLPSLGWEYRTIVFPRGVTREETRRVLTEASDTGRWELARTLLCLGGTRRVWVRRRMMRVQRTF